jgi:hypothetical protein
MFTEEQRNSIRIGFMLAIPLASLVVPGLLGAGRPPASQPYTVPEPIAAADLAPQDRLHALVDAEATWRRRGSRATSR